MSTARVHSGVPCGALNFNENKSSATLSPNVNANLIKENDMKIGDRLTIKGTVGIIKEFDRNSTLVSERTCDRWVDNVEQLIKSGEATLTVKESK